MMLINSPFHQTQAQACAIGAVRTGGIGTVKTLEDMRYRVLRNAHSVVLNLQSASPVILRDTNVNMAARAGEFDGVVDQVQYDSFHPAGIARHLHAWIAMP